jgi:hypothetical protein
MARGKSKRKRKRKRSSKIQIRKKPDVFGTGLSSIFSLGWPQKEPQE